MSRGTGALRGDFQQTAAFRRSTKLQSFKRAPSFQDLQITDIQRLAIKRGKRNRYMQVGNSSAAALGPVGSSVGTVAGNGHLFIAARITKQTATLLVNVRTRPLSYRANCFKGDPWIVFVRLGSPNKLEQANGLLCGTFVRRRVRCPASWSESPKLKGLVDAVNAVRL